jgi:hypothetical protein
LKAFESQDGGVIDVQEFVPIDKVDPASTIHAAERSGGRTF